MNRSACVQVSHVLHDSKPASAPFSCSIAELVKTIDVSSLRAEMDFDSTSLSLENHRLKDQLASYVVLQEQNAKLKEMLEVTCAV